MFVDLSAQDGAKCGWKKIKVAVYVYSWHLHKVYVHPSQLYLNLLYVIKTLNL